jgi:lactate dehydrogenase-like 2-hydroxyacid dehydrogenase
MASMGVVALHYHMDNEVFTTAEFQVELAKLNQGLSLSGVGAHHQNAVAERAIGTVVSLARNYDATLQDALAQRGVYQALADGDEAC